MRPTRADGRPDREILTLDHVVLCAQAKHAAVYLPSFRGYTCGCCGGADLPSRVERREPVRGALSHPV